MPSISRRALLAGGASLGAVVGGIALPASLLPGPVAAGRTQLRPVPEVDARPPVGDAHVADAADWLERRIERASDEWSQVDDQGRAVERLPGLADPGRAIESARDYLADARNGSGWDALFDARRGAQFAGEAVGGARLARGVADGETLSRQGREILEAVAAERDRTSYEVGDPSTGLARLFWVEKWLGLASLNAYRNGVYAGQDAPTTEYDDHDVVRTWGSQLQAKGFRADAARLRRDYRDSVGDSRRVLADHVEGAARRLTDDAESLAPGYDDHEQRVEQLESLPEGAYRSFRGELTTYGYGADVRRNRGPWAGLALYRAVENAAAVLSLRAVAAVREDRRFDEGDGVSGAMLDRAKQTALSRLRDRLSTAEDRPLVGLLTREGRRLLWAGDHDLERGEADHPRGRAYAKYRLAATYLDRVEDVAAVIDRPGET